MTDHYHRPGWVCGVCGQLTPRPKPVLGPTCQDCGLLALRSQEACFRLMPACRQFGPAKDTTIHTEGG